MQIYMDFVIVWNWKSVWILYGFENQLWIWNGYGILILDEMDYGMDLDKDSDPFGPSAHKHNIILYKYNIS